MLKTWIPGTTDFRDQGLDPTDWVNDNVEISNDGKLGKCLYFNGSNARLSSHTYSLGEKWSWSVWIKDDPDVTGWRIAFILNSNGSDADTQTALWVRADETRLEVCNDAKWVSTVKYIPGQWNHIAQTYDGTTTNVYLNGSRISGFTSPDHLVRTNMTIGGRSTSVDGGHVSTSNYYKGYLNDFRIWDNEVLTLQQIKRLSQGLCLHYRLSGVGGENLLSNDKSNWGAYTCSNGTYSGSSSRFAPYKITIPISPSTKYICHITDHLNLGEDFYIGVHQLDSSKTFLHDSGWKKAPYTFTSRDDAAYVRLVFRDGLNNATNIQNYINAIGSSVLIKFEESDHPTPWTPNPSDPEYSTMGLDDGIEYDCSGFGNNGTRVGDFSWSTDTPRYLGSTIFDGNITHINCGKIENLFDAVPFSIAFWIYSGENGTRGIIFGAYGNSSTSSFLNIEINNGSSTNNYLRFDWKGLDKGFGGIYIPYQQWSHIAITYDGSYLKAYQDGVLKKNVTTTLDTIGTNGDYYIGKDNRNGSTAFKGNISDFRIYSTALSASDVLALYNLGGSLDSNGTFHTYEYVEV